MNAHTRIPADRRQLIEARIELLLDHTDRLIAALDADEVDPDLEETGDDEAPLGWANGGPQTHLYVTDEREVVCEDEGAQCEDEGGDINDQPQGDACPSGDANMEPSLGWTGHINQELAGQVDPKVWNPGCDEEPSLGFVGHGTGWRDGEGADDREDDDEREEDCSEADTPGFIAGGNEEGERSRSYGHAATGPAMFDGRGYVEAAEALLNAGPRIVELPTPTVGERCHVLPSGDVLRTAVPYQSGYIRPTGALPGEDSPDMTDFSAYAPRPGGEGKTQW
jgi:hypothetical protein